MKTQNRNRTFGIKSILVVVSLIILGICVSCEKPPSFSKTPAIEFDTIIKTLSIDPDLLVETNNIAISIRFQDGDGDLGVETTDLSNVKYRSYSDTAVVNGDTTFTFKNYYLDIFRKNDSIYTPIETFLSFNGSFEPLIDYSEIGPIDGVLTFDFKLIENSALSSGFEKNDTVRFEVFIVDRELNESNRVATSDIILFED